MPYKFGDIVYVNFPFTDQSASKKRPAVIVSRVDYNTGRPDVFVMPITNRLRPASGSDETAITDWSDAGLLKASAVKPLIGAIAQDIIRGFLGSMSRRDRKSVSEAIARFIGDEAD